MRKIKITLELPEGVILSVLTKYKLSEDVAHRTEERLRFAAIAMQRDHHEVKMWYDGDLSGYTAEGYLPECQVMERERNERTRKAEETIQRWRTQLAQLT